MIVVKIVCDVKLEILLSGMILVETILFRKTWAVPDLTLNGSMAKYCIFL